MSRSFALLTLLYANSVSAGVQEFVTTSYSVGDFKLVWEDLAADVYVEPGEARAVRTAATLFAEDVERITGRKPLLKNNMTGLSNHAVIAGTFGESQAIQELADASKINGAELAGKWETFLIQVVPDPFPGLETALVIAGSDRRGTMYGLLEVSENMGVSPWYWFADVACQPQPALVVKNGTYREGPPSVRYRGIFINDEMWSLRPWAMNTHPDEGHGLGPKTYRRIFELMARLRANYLWPAMHNGVGGTTPFNVYEQNKVVADDYAIVMGSSHIEPMLRNNISGAEWDREYPGEAWNYRTNREHIYKYWEDRVKANGRYENIYTVGKRGKDDEAGSEITVDLLERIIADQRKILKEWVHRDVTKVPQVLIPYTEVLGLYNKGLAVPDDITICWPDNNYGYIRQLPNKQEQARTGGSGIYYHYQWLTGAHHAYTWLSTTPPGLTWSEMKKAYDYSVNRLWVVNVGDIKPEEITIEYFMQMAWDITPFRDSPRARDFFVRWATRDFGAAYAEAIADILERHFELGYARRPEHMVMKSGDAVRSDWFSLEHYNDEAGRRIAAYDELNRDVDALYARLPRECKDAFFEMVVYNVKNAALHNKKAIYAHKSAAYGAQKRASAADYADMAQAAVDEIDAIIEHYNTGLVSVGDKWNLIAGLPGPWGGQFRHWDMPPVSRYAGHGRAMLHVALEGGSDDTLAGFSFYNQDKRFVDLYNSGSGSIEWSAECREDWIRLSQDSGEFTKEQRIWVTIDWDKAPKGERQLGTVIFKGTGKTLRVEVPVFNPSLPAPDRVEGFVESHGYVSIEAEHFSRKTNRGGAGWTTIPSLGRTGGSVTVQPPTVAARTSVEDIQENSASLEYDLFLFSQGDLSLTLHCIPTENINADYGQRIAVAFDDERPRTITAGRRDMLSNLMTMQATFFISRRGHHTLKLWMVDPGMVLDKIILDTGGVKESYLGPPESYYHCPEGRERCDRCGWLAGLAACCRSREPNQEVPKKQLRTAEEGFTSMFNGQDLTGWDGKPGSWEVRDGEIWCTGASQERNWLIWRKSQPGDFVLRLEFRWDKGNSGVQVRSDDLGEWQVFGYQVEVARQNVMGLWHHSLLPRDHAKRQERHLMALAGEKVVLSEAGKKSVTQVADAERTKAHYTEHAWNTLEIIAQGDTLTQKINGRVFSVLTDRDREMKRRKGFIAFQDHGKGCTVAFRNIRIKELP